MNMYINYMYNRKRMYRAATTRDVVENTHFAYFWTFHTVIVFHLLIVLFAFFVIPWIFTFKHVCL